MEPTAIKVKGAREHNLRDISVTLPRGKLLCFTGVSGSGKSSFAFDTLFAEGQRRYLESLSSYARQFLGQLAKPDVDQVTGLSPAIAIQQKTSGWNPRSTVGTIVAETSTPGLDLSMNSTRPTAAVPEKMPTLGSVVRIGKAEISLPPINRRTTTANATPNCCLAMMDSS